MVESDNLIKKQNVPLSDQFGRAVDDATSTIVNVCLPDRRRLIILFRMQIVFPSSLITLTLEALEYITCQITLYVLCQSGICIKFDSLLYFLRFRVAINQGER